MIAQKHPRQKALLQGFSPRIPQKKEKTARPERAAAPYADAQQNPTPSRPCPGRLCCAGPFPARSALRLRQALRPCAAGGIPLHGRGNAPPSLKESREAEKARACPPATRGPLRQGQSMPPQASAPGKPRTKSARNRPGAPRNAPFLKKTPFRRKKASK